jgi:hypothetical protein
MRASGYERAVNDWYTEPSWLVCALAHVEPFDGLVWDPCCCGGNIPKTLADHGVLTHGSDIADRGYGPQRDFFREMQPVDNIVSNPPSAPIEQFIDHALLLARRKVVVLARLAFLEGQARRARFTNDWPLARVWVSSRRPSMPPGGTDVKASGGSIAYAWFVFERGNGGEPTLGWLP